jgi:hypothetical protein
MKRKTLIVLLIFFFVGCSSEYYKTRENRIKQNYYNGIQFQNNELKQKYEKKYRKIIKKK